MNVKKKYIHVVMELNVSINQAHMSVRVQWATLEIHTVGVHGVKKNVLKIQIV